MPSTGMMMLLHACCCVTPCADCPDPDETCPSTYSVDVGTITFEFSGGGTCEYKDLLLTFTRGDGVSCNDNFWFLTTGITGNSNDTHECQGCEIGCTFTNCVLRCLVDPEDGVVWEIGIHVFTDLGTHALIAYYRQPCLDGQICPPTGVYTLDRVVPSSLSSYSVPDSIELS